jgi:uncharacterized protein (DUF1810 family)
VFIFCRQNAGQNHSTTFVNKYFEMQQREVFGKDDNRKLHSCIDEHNVFRE